MIKSKGEHTKAMIVQKAATLFNCRGYRSSSIADIMQETGLRKGGIYNHFESKEDLMASAFSYAISTMRQHYVEALADKKGCLERLLAIASVFQKMAHSDLFPGGCPIMNAAIEGDDADLLLRDIAQTAMTDVFTTIQTIVQKGQANGEVRADVDPASLATVMVSLLEGALMLSKLYGQTEHMERATDHLRNFLTAELRPIPS